jgi:hypothetical protein
MPGDNVRDICTCAFLGSHRGNGYGFRVLGQMVPESSLVAIFVEGHWKWPANIDDQDLPGRVGSNTSPKVALNSRQRFKRWHA